MVPQRRERTLYLIHRTQLGAPAHAPPIPTTVASHQYGLDPRAALLIIDRSIIHE